VLVEVCSDELDNIGARRDTKRYGNNLSYTHKVTRNPHTLYVTIKISTLLIFFNEINIELIYTRVTLCQRGDYRMAPYPGLCPCLSQVSVLSKRMNGLIQFLVWWLPSTTPTLCFKEILVSAKIRALPSGTLSQTTDLKNLTMAYRSSKRVINLARESGRSERDKLNRCRLNC